MFTDDSVIISSHADPKIASENLCKDLTVVSDYFEIQPYP